MFFRRYEKIIKKTGSLKLRKEDETESIRKSSEQGVHGAAEIVSDQKMYLPVDENVLPL